MRLGQHVRSVLSYLLRYHNTCFGPKGDAGNRTAHVESKHTHPAEALSRPRLSQDEYGDAVEMLECQEDLLATVLRYLHMSESYVSPR